MLQEITFALTSLNTTKELMKSAFGMVKDSAARDAITEINIQMYSLTETLLKAQIEYQTLIDVKKELEQKLLNYEKWDAEAPNYELLEVSYGVRVYVEKSDQQRMYSKIWFCPTCFENRKKHVIQMQRSHPSPSEYVCNHCKSIFRVRHMNEA
jgi:hypothetical protein